MAAVALRSLCFCVLLNLTLISLALAQDDNHFIYNGFNESKLHLDGLAKVLPNGLLQLTNISQLQSGYGFYPSPIKFDTSSSRSLSFSTHFVFSMVPKVDNFGGNGIAFVFSPSLDFSESIASAYLGLFNVSNNGQSANHILAIELDTVQSLEFNDIDGNHVGIDVNSLISTDSATAAYFSDKEGKNKSLALDCGDPIQMWIDYSGAEKLINVTLAPITVPKPSRPLLSTSIDLSEIFLDTLYVGFSSATGGALISEHYILGWSFNKTRQAKDLDISKLPPPPSLRKTTTVSRASDGWSFNTSGQAQNLDKSKLPPPPPPRKASGKQEIWAQIAVAVLTAAIMIGTNLAILLFFFMRWRRARLEGTTHYKKIGIQRRIHFVSKSIVFVAEGLLLPNSVGRGVVSKSPSQNTYCDQLKKSSPNVDNARPTVW